MMARSRSVAAPVVLRIVSDPAYLCVARATAERFCLLVGFDDKSAQAVGLALDEALANVIRHGYDGRIDQPIHVEFQMHPAEGESANVAPGGGESKQQEGAAAGASDDGRPDRGELRIRVRDFGRQVDEAAISPRSLEDIRPGGLGVHIMRSIMDRVEYRRRGLTGMELWMTKRGPQA